MARSHFYEMGPSPWCGSNLGSLKFMSLMVQCKPPRQLLERKRDYKYQLVYVCCHICLLWEVLQCKRCEWSDTRTPVLTRNMKTIGIASPHYTCKLLWMESEQAWEGGAPQGGYLSTYSLRQLFLVKMGNTNVEI